MRSIRLAAGVICAAFAAALFGAAPAGTAGNACADLARLSSSTARITQATIVEAGAFPQDADAFRRLPSFCRVAATLAPSSDSDIHIEVWLPTTGWNGKLLGVGNGAFSGAIAYPALANGLARHYAAASTDTGHSGGSASFALGHPDKVIDFGWRAVHEMTVSAKKIVAEYYATPAKQSYWTGCSAGGRQALKAAQQFPADFDGIVAGAPGLDWTGRAAQALRLAKRYERPEARLLPPQRQLLHQAALQACDALDGVTDGVIENPKTCAFRPDALKCKGAADSTCLSAEQVETARLMYATAANAATGREIPGLEPGSELGWTDAGWTASARATGVDQFRFIVFKNANWNPSSFDFDADLPRAERMDEGTINALDANITPFFDRGGKLIQYHGWNDPQIAPGNSPQYYTRVVRAAGGEGKIRGSYRLFMAPGMAHCGGGEGPNAFDMLGALERWVESSRAPDRIIAARSTSGAITRTRPLCPYPQVAAYTGAGSTDEAESFVCRAP